MKYRKEIDGLRALAIAAVVLYHAEFVIGGITLCQGGFIGVDIFFVISGYLITSIILNDLIKDRFSFSLFFERRARRILPILFTVIATSIPFAWHFMFPNSVKEYAGSLLSTLSFTSNFWFWQGESYWAEPNNLQPFLHTWSLSIEAQFYLLYPIFLILFWKFAQRYLFLFFGLTFGLSLLLTHMLNDMYTDATFYLLPTRGWELMAGGLLAWLEIEKGRVIHRGPGALMPLMGLVLVCTSFVLFDDQTTHPSLITMIPVAGTMLLLWFCREGEVVSEILRSKFLVALGLISYGLYVWHYPVFAFAHITMDTLTVSTKVVIILATIALSILTYILIEKPARDRTRFTYKKLTWSLMATAATFCLVFGYAYGAKGQWFRYDQYQLSIISQDKNRLVDYVISEYDRFRGKPFDPSNLRDDLLFVGDSYSQDFFNILRNGGFLEGKDISTHYIHKGCNNVAEQDDYQDHIPKKDRERCTKTVRVGNPKLHSKLKEAELIILASSWNDFTSRRLPNLVNTIKSISNARVLVIGRKHFGHIDRYDLANLAWKERSQMRQINQSHLEVLNSLPIRKLENYLDMHKLVCGDSDSCPVFTPDSFLISFDGVHLTRQGAAYIGELLQQDPDFMVLWKRVFPDSNPGRNNVLAASSTSNNNGPRH